jgi:hypothetical protein
MYDHVRYFTVTERHVPGTPETIEEREEQLRQLYDEVRVRRRLAKEVMRKAEARPAAHQGTSVSGDTPYGLQALHEACEALSQTGEGSRNTQLNRTAFRLGQLVGGHELTRSTVQQTLYDAAARAGLPKLSAHSAAASQQAWPSHALHQSGSLPLSIHTLMKCLVGLSSLLLRWQNLMCHSCLTA